MKLFPFFALVLLTALGYAAMFYGPKDERRTLVLRWVKRGAIALFVAAALSLIALNFSLSLSTLKVL